MSRVTTMPHAGWRAFAPLASIALSLLLIPAAAISQDAEGGAPGDWLSRYSGARSIGFGDAQVALATGPMVALWNSVCFSHTTAWCSSGGPPRRNIRSASGQPCAMTGAQSMAWEAGTGGTARQSRRSATMEARSRCESS